MSLGYMGFRFRIQGFRVCRVYRVYRAYNPFPLIINDVPPPNNEYSGGVKKHLSLGGNIY